MIPRNFFPNMPDEVFEMWLNPISEYYGWPFKKPSDPIEGTIWAKMFSAYDLNFWVTANWRLDNIAIFENTFTNSTCFRLNSIITRCVEGLPTFTANVEGAEERFRTCAGYIRANGNIPKPIIALIKNGEVEIIDGYHRIAALLHVGIPIGHKVLAWITELNETK